jgi:hypothetical protein
MDTKSILLSMVLLALLVVAGCKKDSSGPTTPSAVIPPALAATWTAQSATMNGVPTTLANALYWDANAAYATFTFGSDGNAVYSEFNASNALVFGRTGTLQVSGTSFTLTLTAANGVKLTTPLVLAGTWATSGDQLTFTMTVSGVTWSFVLVKSSGGTVIPSALVGTWTPQSATVNGTATPVNVALNFVSSAVKANFVLGANGSYTYQELDAGNAVVWSETGTIAVSGQNITIKITATNGTALPAPVSFTGTWALSGSQVSLTLNQSGSIVVLVLGR